LSSLTKGKQGKRKGKKEKGKGKIGKRETRESKEKKKGNVGSHRRRYKPRGSFDLSTGRGKIVNG
jgi:hypothetical protein